MTICFVKPSVRRLLWSVIAVAVLSCVIAGVCLFIGVLVTYRHDPNPTSTGDYIRLFIWFILLYGPSLLLITWFVSVPAMVALGVLVACVRRTPAADVGSQRSAAEERSGPG
jgi:hypothetical protein